MTTKSSQKAHCEHCAAAVVAAAALREAANRILAAASGSVEEHEAMQEIATLLDNPSPAVDALERRLACAAQTEEQLTAMELAYLEELTEMRKRLAPMPCGHPGACAMASDDYDTGYCGWCAAELGYREWKARAKAQETRLARAEAAEAALVPGIITALGCAAYWLDEGDKIGAVDGPALAANLRALADSIEDARKETEDE